MTNPKKIKLYIFIQNAARILEGNYYIGLSICGDDMFEYLSREYTLIETIEIDESKFDAESLTAQAVESCNIQIRQVRAVAESKINEIKDRRDKLLSITHQPESAQ